MALPTQFAMYGSLIDLLVDQIVDELVRPETKSPARIITPAGVALHNGINEQQPEHDTTDTA
jgi:hypothetical protein